MNWHKGIEFYNKKTPNKTTKFKQSKPTLKTLFYHQHNSNTIKKNMIQKTI